jgi:hypothetical protein
VKIPASGDDMQCEGKDSKQQKKGWEYPVIVEILDEKNGNPRKKKCNKGSPVPPFFKWQL